MSAAPQPTSVAQAAAKLAGCGLQALPGKKPHKSL